MASRYWIGGGTNSNWNASPSTNWAASSGDTVRVAAPTSSDDVFFDGAGVTGNSASIMSTGFTVLSVTFSSGYTQTVTVNAVLQIAGNFTDHTAHSWAGSSNMTISAASTITSNGKAWPNSVIFSGTNTKTLSGDWTITGSLTLSANTVINSGTLTLGGLTTNSGSATGTTTINLVSGTWAGSVNVQNNLTISGNVTITSVLYNTGTLTYSSGTVTHSGTLTCGASTTWNTAGISWNNITFSATGTQTINSLLTVNFTMQIAQGASMTFTGTSGFYVATLNAINTTAGTHTFKNGLTYTIWFSFQSYLAPNSNGNLFISDDGTLRANIILLNASTLCNSNARFTRINAGGGRSIVTFNQTITDSINVFNQTNVLFRPMETFVRGPRRLSMMPNNNKSVIFQ